MMKRFSLTLAAIVTTITITSSYVIADGHAHGHSHATSKSSHHTSHAVHHKNSTSHKNQTFALNKNKVNKNKAHKQHTHNSHKIHHFPHRYRFGYARWAPWLGCWVYYDRYTSAPYFYSEGCGCYRPVSECPTLAEPVDEPDGAPPCPDCENSGSPVPDGDMDTPEPPQ